MTITELHNVSLDSFIEAVEQCKGNVWLITEDGDKLNLKSRFCQILGLAKIVEGGMIAEAKIYCENADDLSLLFRFNLYGEKILRENAEAAKA